jgi:hypothetical protein
VSERRTDERADAGHDGAGSAVEGRAEGGRGAGAADAPARFDFVSVFRVAAFLLFATASVLLYLRLPEAAFLSAALGAAAWFLGVRTALIRKHDLVKVGGRNWRPRSEVEEDAGEDVEEDEKAVNREP